MARWPALTGAIVSRAAVAQGPVILAHLAVDRSPYTNQIYDPYGGWFPQLAGRTSPWPSAIKQAFSRGVDDRPDVLLKQHKMPWHVNGRPYGALGQFRAGRHIANYELSDFYPC
jgi:hypothetical protein